MHSLPLKMPFFIQVLSTIDNTAHEYRRYTFSACLPGLFLDRLKLQLH